MPERERQEPPAEPRRPRTQEARRAREAEALRANLKRRKQQARARKGATAIAPDSVPR